MKPNLVRVRRVVSGHSIRDSIWKNAMPKQTRKQVRQTESTLMSVVKDAVPAPAVNSDNNALVWC